MSLADMTKPPSPIWLDRRVASRNHEATPQQRLPSNTKLPRLDDFEVLLFSRSTRLTS